jgi:hypothetical protein
MNQLDNDASAVLAAAASGAGAVVARRPASDLLPLALAFVAEGAWLSVLAGLVQEFAKREPVLGLAEMAVLVTLGAIAGRLTSGRLGGGWPVLAAGLVSIAAIGGVFASAASRDVLANDGLAGIGAALGANPGGLLAGLAMLRGTGYSTPALPEDRLERLLTGGTAAIVGAAILGGFVPDPWRERFVADTLIAAVAFAASAIVALALRRHALAGRDRGADWQRNPRWVVLLLVVVAAIAVLAALSAGLVRPALEMLVALALLPLILVGLIVGWTRRGMYLGLAYAIVASVVALVFNLFGERTRVIEPAPGGAGLPPAQAPLGIEPSVIAFGSGLLVVLAVIAAYLLARLWARRRAADPADATEERFIDRRSTPPSRHRRRSWFGWRAQPADAAAAYRTLLRDLASREEVRREPWETPREHAARLRREQAAGLPLELLAADYSLVAFGGVPLTAREQRRALARWRALRRSIRPPPMPELPG